MKKMIGSAVVLLACVAGAAKVENIKIHSAAMDKDVPAAVILPDGYAADEAKRWPVVYVLHGAGGNFSGYSKAPMTTMVDEYGFIAVCPDGGKTSWWLDSPIDPRMKYETHVVKEVVPFVDANYRTINDRAKRAIMGGSMGGHGACFLGIRHKDIFGAIGNIYGGVDLRPFPDNWDIKLRLGTIQEHPEHWEEYSVVTQAKTLKNSEVSLITAIGTSDFFLKVNREFHDLLTKNEVEHAYVEVRAENTKRSSHGTFRPIAEKIVGRFIHNFFIEGRGRL